MTRRYIILWRRTAIKGFYYWDTLQQRILFVVGCSLVLLVAIYSIPEEGLSIETWRTFELTNGTRFICRIEICEGDICDYKHCCGDDVLSVNKAKAINLFNGGNWYGCEVNMGYERRT